MRSLWALKLPDRKWVFVCFLTFGGGAGVMQQMKFVIEKQGEKIYGRSWCQNSFTFFAGVYTAPLKITLEWFTSYLMFSLDKPDQHKPLGTVSSCKSTSFFLICIANGSTKPAKSTP